MLVQNVTVPIRKEIAGDEFLRSPNVFDLDEMLSLTAIREHTKTDDVPHVTDNMLRLYRQAGFEAAEKYTGMLFTRQQTVEEIIKVPQSIGMDLRRTVRHRLRYPSASPYVYVFGLGANERVAVEIGARVVHFPNVFQSLAFASCCNPCGNKDPYKVMYLAGYDSCAGVPAGIILGVLKFIAWTIENPGDVLKTVDNGSRSSSDFLRGTNSAVVGSGALDEWRLYLNDIAI